jgi:predicted enzyme related to lactoylglutathione lyase
MPRVIHFEISANDPERAVKFYSDVFGWNIDKWGGPVDYWLISSESNNEPGINGAIFKHPGSVDANIINTIGVPSIEEFIQKIEENGGKVIRPKMAIPGIGYHAYCKDTEGNIFGIMQDDPSAK